MQNYKIGNGYDVHRFGAGKKLILGGVEIDHPYGLIGHSDADVLVHAIIDSLLSPSDMGDIGQMFPDTDPANKDASSIDMLHRVYGELTRCGYRIINTDSVVICDKPKISAYISSMKEAISKATNYELAPENIGIKGKTTEGLGFTGRGEGIAVYTVSLLHKTM